MNHAQLISAVESRLNRTDVTDLIPSFIQRAEDAIQARLAASPVRPMGASATSTLTAGETSAALPSDFIDAIDLKASDGTDTWQLVRIDSSDPSAYYSTRSLPYGQQVDSAKPLHYSILGSSIELSKASTSNLTLTLKYWQKLTALATSENWLAQAHANVYEFGTLAHAYKHLRDDEAAAMNLDLFTAAIDLALESYPERQNPGELRSDLPIRSAWSILNG